jgi:acetylornithine deacetylase/succinyl-diaminopimelate desuccinylase-like protein
MEDWAALAAAVTAEVEAGMPDLFGAMRIQSVGAWGMTNLLESARYLSNLLTRDGWETEIVEVPGNAVVFARIGPGDAQRRPTILLYGHHDVQPPEPIEAWTTPPFEPVIRDGRLWGRGSSDDKGEFFCHLFAVRALRKLRGDIGVQVKLFLDGGEENASPSLDQAVDRLRDRLQADFMYSADGPAHIDGRPRISFGFRGALRMRLRVRTMNRNLHAGAWGNVAPNAALRLAQILADIKDRDGRVRVAGFYDRVRPPKEPERRALEAIPFDDREAALLIGARELDGPSGVPAQERIQFLPSLNVSGLVAGYTGPGFQGAIPATAEARLAVSFVPDQTAEELFALLRDHLARNAPEADLELISHWPTSRTPLDTPATPRVVEAMRRGYGVEPILYPCSGGSAPEAFFTKGLGLPSLWGHCANHDQQNHAPDENFDLGYLRACARTTAALLDGLSASRL